MSGRRYGKKHGAGGYTLAELLIVVGIIAILAAVSFPALINMRNSLRQTELDDRAKEIFIVAQNQMSGLKLCGKLPVPEPEGADGRKLDESLVPSDYTEGQGEKPDTYALCQGDSGFQWMNGTAFAPGLTKADGGSYVIEYNRGTGRVYAVFYWEESGGAFQRDSLFSYPENFNQYDSLDLRGADNRKNRMTPSVGYYGGEAAALVEGTENLEFAVNLRNAEELQVTISMDQALWDRTAYQIDIESKTDPAHSQIYTYRLKGRSLSLESPADGVQSAELGFDVEAAGNGKSEYTIILDSLRPGLHFADNFSGIAAGDDLRISVTGYGASSDKLYLPQVRTVEINSLFAGLRSGDGRGEEVLIENGRHLQNLSYEVSGLGMRLAGTGWKTEEYSDFSPVRAVLIRDIDWAEAVYGENGAGGSWDQVCTARGGSGEKVNFYPISNDRTQLKTVAGNGHVIRNLHVSRNAVLDYGGRGYGYAGLFGYMEGAEGENRRVKLSGINLVNPVIEPGLSGGGAMESYAGALAGYLKDGVVERCGAYIDGTGEENLSERYQACGVISQNSFAGGLVGRGQNLRAEDSFASLKVSAGITAGGFAGSLAGRSAVSGCYSGGHTESGAYSQERPNVSGRSRAGGFAGAIEDSAAVNTSFSTCSVWGTACGPFVGAAAVPDNITLTYALGSTFAAAGGESNSIGCGPLDGLAESGAEKPSHTGTYPYDELYRKEQAAAYPYPSWQKSYRGDWAGGGMTTGLVYYEKYDTSLAGGAEFGFWSPDMDGDSTLRDDAPVLSDGYGYLGSREGGEVMISGEGDHLKRIQVKASDSGDSQQLYPLPWAVVHKQFGDFNGHNNHKNERFYDTIKLEIDGNPATFYYNPHFAKAIATNEAEAGKQPEKAVIRTVRHLYELGYEFNEGSKNNSAYWAAPWDYRQERDADYAAYDLSTYDRGELAQGTIGENASKSGGFVKSYDGEGHLISNLRMERGSGEAALFGTVGPGGTVKNLVIDNPVVKSSQGAAGLVLQNYGTVTEVLVVSPKIYSESGAAAGFVIDNEGQGTISNSYVLPRQPGNLPESDRYRHVYDENWNVTANNYANALITCRNEAAGFAANNAGTIEMCGAAGAVTTGVYDEAFKTVSPEYGNQAAGFVNANSGRIRNSYANCYTASRFAAGFVNTSSNEISGCYALRRVITLGAGSASGFAGSASGIRNCYAAVSNGYSSGYRIVNGQIRYEDCVYTDAFGVFLYPFSAVSGEKCYVLSWSENYIKDGQTAIGAKAVTYRQLRDETGMDGLVKARADGSDTEAFSRLLGPVFPFPKAQGLIQYGDWPSYEYVGAEMAYFEVYKEGSSSYSVGFYNEAIELDTLRDDKQIFLDGYSLLFNEEYIDMDDINVQNLIQGSSSSNKKAYITWMDNNTGGDNNVASATNYLKSVYNLKDNSGKVFTDSRFKGNLWYYTNVGGSKAAFERDSVYGDKPVSLKLDGRDGRYYFRILPPAAVVTNAYVEEDSIYQELSVFVESNYRDEGGGQGVGTAVEKSRTFYYCPHFAKSDIGVGERPDETYGGDESGNEKELLVRTSRQLCTLGFENITGRPNGIDNYYGRTFRQELDIALGQDNAYAYYYSDGAPMTSGDGRPRQDYRWFNSAIGSQNIPFTGTYLGDGHKITGLGAWSEGPRDLPEFSSMSKFNVNTPLFGYLNGTVEDLVLANSNISGENSALCGSASGAHIRDVMAVNIKLRPGNLEKPAGILAGEATGTVFETCAIENSSVINDQASWLGCAVGKMYSGSIEGLGLSGEITVQGRRAVGGVIGQVLSSQEVSLSSIKMEGTADIRQMQANHSSGENRALYNAAGLLVGICEVNYPVTLEGIDLSGIPGSAGINGSGDGLLKVRNGSDCLSSVGGLLVGSLYRSGASNGNTLIVGTVSVRNGRLLTDEVSNAGENPVCYYGGIVGNVKDVGIRPASGASVWDFSTSRIVAVSGKMNRDSAVSGLAGRFSTAASLLLPDELYLPDIQVKAPDSAVTVGGVLGRAGGTVTVKPANGTRSVVHLGSVTAEGCQNAGGLTAVISDKTVFQNIAVAGGEIQTDKIAGAVAGTVNTKAALSHLSAEGTLVTGIRREDGGVMDSVSLGGFVGSLDGGTVEDCFAAVRVQGSGPAPAGGFAGTINSGTVRRCYASGEVSGCADTGGFFGVIAKTGTVQSCYASGDVSLGEGAAKNASIGGFGGSLGRTGNIAASVRECYCVGRVPEALPAGAAAGGFLGYVEGADTSFGQVDPMIMSLIHIMKQAEVHNRPAAQNGNTIWNMQSRPAMDSSTFGVLDGEGNSALVYNILGYPYYPDMMKVGIEGTNQKAQRSKLEDIYAKIIGGTGLVYDPRLQPDYGGDNGDSYYETVYEKSRDLGVMTLWRIENNYLYWINDGDIKEGTYTAFRVNLPKYEQAGSAQERRALIEVNQRMEVKYFNSSYSTSYYVLQTGSGVWNASNLGDCFFLREDGTSQGLKPYNAAYQGIDGLIEGWSVARFEEELRLEAHGQDAARLTQMQPNLENTGNTYAGYPFPMLSDTGAGLTGLYHIGGWPREYHPVCR